MEKNDIAEAIEQNTIGKELVLKEEPLFDFSEEYFHEIEETKDVEDADHVEEAKAADEVDLIGKTADIEFDKANKFEKVIVTRKDVNGDCIRIRESGGNGEENIVEFERKGIDQNTINKELVLKEEPLFNFSEEYFYEIEETKDVEDADHAEDAKAADEVDRIGKTADIEFDKANKFEKVIVTRKDVNEDDVEIRESGGDGVENIVEFDRKVNSNDKLTVVETAIAATGKRRFDKRYCCPYCKKLVLKLPRHLISCHKTETCVKSLAALPPNDPERLIIIERLRNTGNFNHFTEVMKNKSGTVIPKKRTRSGAELPSQFKACEICKVILVKKNLWKHLKTCKKKREKQQTAR